MTTRLVKIRPDGSLEGIYAIGFHGEVLADETPARCGPVYADESGRLVRLMEFGPAGATPPQHIRVETSSQPLPSDAPLPGVGTRVGPWPAWLGKLIVAVGPEEIRRIRAIRAHSPKHEPASVRIFLDWLDGRLTDKSAIHAERQGELAFWYCTEVEGFALWQRIHDVAEEAFFQAVHSGTKYDLEDASFWLSRALVSDQDIYLAAAGLRRAGSPDWEALVTELLHKRSDEERKEGLARAEQLISNPPRFKPEHSDPAPQHRARSAMRRRYIVEAQAEAA